MRRRPWIKPGHCNRCVNGLGHTPRKRKPTGVILQRARPFWDDEIAPGEKAALHGIMRAREAEATRKEIMEEQC
jgi:hypothetical protein